MYNGSLFGIATGGGVQNPNCFYPANVSPSQASCGVVFELTPNKDGSSWSEKVIYSFCEGGGNCIDGASPTGGLILGPGGRLYSTTIFGGAYGTSNTYGGTIFDLTPNPNGLWSYQDLYNFCAKGGANCTDGTFAYDLLTLYEGNLYGTADFGGAYAQGTAFELALPEPPTWAIMLIGFAGLGVAGVRRRRGRKLLD